MTEIELKLALDPRQASRLQHHPLLAATKPSRRRLHSTYLDTPDWDLLQRRIAFRLRKAGRRWLQTLKAETVSVGALSQRAEWEMALPRGEQDLERLPTEALKLLQGLEPSRIVPAFVTDFRRTAWVLEHQGAVVEVALDLGEIRAGTRQLPLAEVEIELQSGPPEALFDLALALLERIPMQVEPRSKSARGYTLAGALQPVPVKSVAPALAPAMRAGQAWPRLAGAALAQMVANVSGFLHAPEEVGYLHQLRVGLRRLRSVAGLATSLGQARPAWDAGLKALMQQLNPARDWDVFLQHTLPRLADALGGPPLPAALYRHFAGRQQAARTRAQAALTDEDFTRLVLEIGRDLLTNPEVATPLDDWARDCLESRWLKLRKRGKGFARLDATQRHRLRIAVKRLRYIADVLLPAWADDQAPARTFLARLKRLQNHLGIEQDRQAASLLLDGLRQVPAALRFDAGRLAGLLAAQKGGRKGKQAWLALTQTPPYWRLRTRR